MRQYLIIFIYAAVMLFIIGLFVGSYFTVSCRIDVLNNEVIKGNDIDLFYEINNRMFTEDIFNVEFKYWVVQEAKTVVAAETDEIPKIPLLKDYRSFVTVTLSHLDKGKYTIWTQTTYSVGETITGRGNRESKLLSIDIYII